MEEINNITNGILEPNWKPTDTNDDTVLNEIEHLDDDVEMVTEPPVENDTVHNDSQTGIQTNATEEQQLSKEQQQQFEEKQEEHYQSAEEHQQSSEEEPSDGTSDSQGFNLEFSEEFNCVEFKVVEHQQSSEEDQQQPFNTSQEFIQMDMSQPPILKEFKEEPIIIMRTCTNGHRLSFYIIPTRNASICNQCNCMCEQMLPMFGCKKCNYDCCIYCADIPEIKG